ncbi:MAG: ATP-dependent DNA helicase RecG [Chloroflexi bacterium]|nr:ATP-dependent DNA helicase RecG [Chloroflexota bacterium]
MPSALETLVKILKLERDQGAKNTAVVGGLGDYARTWQQQAREQARRPHHQILIDEIVDSLGEYEKIETQDKRIEKINYLLDRIVNRQKAPPEYKNRLSEWESKMRSQPDSPPRRSPGPPRRHHVDRRTARQPRSGAQNRFHAYDSASYDEDFTGGPRQNRLDIPPMPSLDRPPRRNREEQSLAAQREILDELVAPTTEINGIGNKYAELLSQLNLHTVRDLLYSLPRDYVDYTRMVPIRDLQEGQTANVIATVTRASTVAGSSGNMDLLIQVSDETATMSLRFFSQPYLSVKLRKGIKLLLRGKVRYYRDMPQMANPEWEELDLENLRNVGIVPVYRMTKGLRPRMFRRTMKSLTSAWETKIPDPIPHSVLERNDLADLGWAISQAHFPDGDDHKCHAKRRLAFDHLLMLQLALLGKRRAWQSVPGPQLDVDAAFVNQFIQDVFPFDLTNDQRRAIEDIQHDVSSTLPMNRLVQGDVGSGKTAVALVALAIAFANGKQSALMAPTAVLAEQHYRAVSQTFARMSGEDKPNVKLLTSALSAAEREAAYRDITVGAVDIVVGTQALIQEGLEFDDLAVAVIDEQQRFGVVQRSHLRGKGGNPHLLVMSATPFPRTLALTVFADLDLTVISEKPAGRKDVKTWIIDPAARERLNGFVIEQLTQGRQAFFIHPLVEKSETVETPSAVEAYDQLCQVFYRFRVCLLHGRLSAAEKDELMADFAARKYDVMVTTSVAEVGVDVPNASVIVIDGANRFGLAQLHQFRGRVGRAEHQSYCFLIPDSSTEIDIDRIHAAQAGGLNASELTIAEQRLSAMEESNDGFVLADRDWQLRGTGELMGTRQSGRYEIDLLDPSQVDLARLAQQEALTLYEEDPELKQPEHQLLAEFVRKQYPGEADFS